MSKRDKRRHKRLHFATRLAIGCLISLAVMVGSNAALIVLTFAWLFEPELVRFERKAISIIEGNRRG